MTRHILSKYAIPRWVTGPIVTILIILLSGVCSLLNAGQVIERDYFTADEDPAWRQQLNINNSAHTDRVIEWVRKENIPMAIDEAKFTLRYWPNHPRALILMELIARSARTPSLPIPYYEKAVRDYPQYALTHAQYGKYLVEIGRVDDGIAHLQQAVELDPKLVAAHAWLAEAYYTKSGSKALARKAAAQARALGYKGELPGETSGQSAK